MSVAGVLELGEKAQKPLAHARGLEAFSRFRNKLPSCDREGAVRDSAFSAT
jgi:hypothetical protein